MSLLEQTILSISKTLNEDAFHSAKERLANQAKPAGSLGGMEDISARLAAIKIAVIKKGLALHRPDPDDPIDVLSKVGGLTGIVPGCGSQRSSGYL